MTTPNPAHTLFDLITAHRITASIYVAARLGVADRLAEAPRTVAELATMVGAHRELTRATAWGARHVWNLHSRQRQTIPAHGHRNASFRRCRQVTQGVGNLRGQDAVAVVGWLFEVHSNWQEPW